MSEFFNQILNIEDACKAMVSERDQIHSRMIDMSINEGRLESKIFQAAQYLNEVDCDKRCDAITTTDGDCTCGRVELVHLLEDHTPNEFRTIPLGRKWKEGDWHIFLKSLGFYESNKIWIHKARSLSESR